MLFVIFDVETVFMFPWAVIFDKLLLFGADRDDRVHLHPRRRLLLRVAEGRVGMGVKWLMTPEASGECRRSPRTTMRRRLPGGTGQACGQRSGRTPGGLKAEVSRTDAPGAGVSAAPVAAGRAGRTET